MTALTLPAFNPMTFAKRLKEAGVPEKQADAEAEVLHDALAAQAQAVSALETQFQALSTQAARDSEQMTTKGDLRELRTELKGDIKLLRWMLGILIAAVASLVLKAYF